MQDVNVNPLEMGSQFPLHPRILIETSRGRVRKCTSNPNAFLQVSFSTPKLGERGRMPNYALFVFWYALSIVRTIVRITVVGWNMALDARRVRALEDVRMCGVSCGVIVGTVPRSNLDLCTLAIIIAIAILSSVPCYFKT